ncbi:hypothetical protein K491DRAFT_330536 [Lophiostoma macrostomum CBS 122681]|uniref:SnoaL-like domain-containing protein n=1 Tax=Lophiostoma macrostomum CBS 122681 TaxID=1314788 RepID=A0A6A6TBJ0_9PLEO|nr:hypothetical protein K491DRAFT_330536 [Lophiostoma macrostomum CBS 122681]
MVSSAVNPLDALAIQNTIARYCEALDTKDWPLLSKVFRPDATGDYPFNNDLRGVDAISSTIQSRLGPITTQHALTTQTITFQTPAHPPSNSSPGSVIKTANTITYFTGNHFGQGPHQGKVLTAYGKYVDELVCESVAEGGNFEGVQGASGIWRINRRIVGFFSRIGDEKIMSEF